MPITQDTLVLPANWPVTFLKRKKSSNHFSIALEFNFSTSPADPWKNAKNTKTDQFFILRKSRILNGKGIYYVSSVWHAICDLIFDYFVSIS